MKGLLEQFGRFLVVGTVTTGLDFGVYNLMTGWLRRSRVVGSLVSTTVAMSFSFTVNWLWVFRPEGGVTVWERAIRFLVVTGSSSWGLQTLVIWALSHPGRWLVDGVERGIRRWVPWTRKFSSDLIQRNFVKAMAVGAGILWNFAGYRWWVYR